MLSKPKSIRTRRAGELLLAACMFAALLIPSAQATPGALDPSFGTGGKVTTAIGPGGDAAWALALQPDGKLVAAGFSNNGSKSDFALARYSPDGSLDTSFNGTGKVTTAIDLGASASALVLQPDGKLVAAGASYNGSNNDFALARYNPDGSLDTNFNGGTVTTAIGPGDDYASAILVQPDGKLVAAGSSWNGSQYVFALARYNPDGSLDTTFHGTGTVTTAIGPSDDEIYGLALQPDGKLVAAGYSQQNGSNDDFALARYNPDGSLDSSFHGTGTVTTAIGPGQDDAFALALQPDGRLVAAGGSYIGSHFVFALARYNPDGSPDTSFNGTGKVTTPIGSNWDRASALALQPDGKLVAAGISSNGSNDDFALARYNPDGSLDTSFNGTGKVTTAVGPGNAVATALVLQPDGKPVAAGYSHNGSNDDFALVRYLNSNTLTVSKGGSGSGSVTSSPNGIECGDTCWAPFAAGPVMLTATPSPGSSFLGWSGDCAGTGPCILSMSADQTATARFESDKTLTVTKAGSGTGTVSSNPAGISCAPSCASSFRYGTTVTLTASAAAGSSFAGWSGAGCSGTGTCTVTLDADKPVTASFEHVQAPALCVVPKVKGKTLKAAKRAIKRAHCSLGKVTRAYSAKVKRGHVISQKPKPGRKLAAGAKVKLKVSKGKKT